MKPVWAILRNKRVIITNVFNPQSYKEREVGRDIINGTLISTIFLALNHSFGKEKNKWFETMVFKDHSMSESYCRRYSTYGEALKGHKKAVQLVKEGKI